MKLDNIPEELFDIIANHQYDDLSSDDNALIKQYLNKEEYEEIHQFLISFSEADDSLENAVTMERQIPKKPMWRKIVNYRMPLYKVAALYLLLAGAYFLYQQNTEMIPEQKGMDKKVSIDEGIYPEDLIFEL